MRTEGPRSGRKPNTSIRINLDILHKARVAAVNQRKTLGQWLEEAILQRLEREQNRAIIKEGGDTRMKKRAADLTNSMTIHQLRNSGVSKLAKRDK